jgi:hypothetical protein
LQFIEDTKLERRKEKQEERGRDSSATSCSTIEAPKRMQDAGRRCGNEEPLYPSH